MYSDRALSVSYEWSMSESTDQAGCKDAPLLLGVEKAYDGDALTGSDMRVWSCQRSG